MYIRLVFLRALVCVLLGATGLGSAQAGFCTAEDIYGGVKEGVPLAKVLEVCEVLDVRNCDAAEVYYMTQEGFSLDEIYYECG